MSTTAPVETVPTPTTIAEAIAALHASSRQMQGAAEKLLELAQLAQVTPELKVVTFNPGNNGQYQVTDKSRWPAKSIGILNASSGANAAAVFLGVGGMSARVAAGVPFCPPGKSLVLPVEARDLELGVDATVLGANSLEVFLFRYLTVQPLAISS